MNSEIPSGLIDETTMQRLIERAARRLFQAGLGRWEVPFCEWSVRFAGLERHADAPEIAPARCVLRLALSYVRTKATPSDAEIARDLSILPFTQWHALWPPWATPSGRSERWRPLEQAFKSFARRYEDADALVVWEGTVPVVSCAEAAAFLMARLATAERSPSSGALASAAGD